MTTCLSTKLVACKERERASRTYIIQAVSFEFHLETSRLQRMVWRELCRLSPFPKVFVVFAKSVKELLG